MGAGYTTVELSKGPKRDVTISAECRKACEELIAQFPKKEGALLNIFRLIEKDIGYVGPEGVAIAADMCDVPRARAWGSFTFYSTYKKHTDGKHLLWVCSTLPCALAGSDAMYDYIKAKLELDEFGTSKDKLITLKKAECLGACGTAPCVQLNDDYYESLTPEKVDALVGALQRGEERPAGFTS